VTASTSGSTDPNSGGSIASSWIDFGDGTAVNATTSNHAYSQPGTYTVLATVYGSSGKSSRTSTTVKVSTVQPTGYLSSAANAINGTQTIPQNGTILVQGWAAENGNPVAQVQVTIDGNVVGNASLAQSGWGWSFSNNIGMLSTGSHWVSA